MQTNSSTWVRPQTVQILRTTTSAFEFGLQSDSSNSFSLVPEYDFSSDIPDDSFDEGDEED